MNEKPELNEEKASAKSKAGSVILVVVACIMAVCAIAALLYVFVFRTPLPSGIAGTWKLTIEGDKAFGGISASLEEALPSNNVDIKYTDVSEYFIFNEDGTYTITADKASIIVSLNSAISSIVDHYSKHSDEFIEATGLSREYFEEHGINDLNMKVFLESLFEPTRENIAQMLGGYETDEKGNIILAFGKYTADGDTVKLTLDNGDGEYSDFGYFKASVRYSVMTVTETDLTSAFGSGEVSLVKMENRK
ncbi:MAG: hypothetical protein IJS45_06835 [Clostridia bacterium]|nr:hypothetical protein [Clostridia bacterium]